MSNKNFILNQSGFTIIQSLIAVSILSAGTAGVMGIGNQVLKIKKTADIHRGASKFRSLLVDTLSTSNSWEATVANPGNTNLDCLKRTSANPLGTDCRGEGGSFVIYNGNEIMIYDPSDVAIRKNGFTISGMYCSDFNGSPGMGNDSCPFRYDVEWFPLCPPLPDTCLDPEVRIVGKLSFNASLNFDIEYVNSGRYNFDFVRDIATNTIKTSCNSLGGVLDSATGNCKLPLEQNCSSLHGPGWVMVGVESRGNLRNTIICKPYIKLCPAGTVMVGLSGGSPQCVNSCLGLPPTPPPPVPVFSEGSSLTFGWSDGGGDGDGCGDGGGGDGGCGG